jgi:hypothetical protein
MLPPMPATTGPSLPWSSTTPLQGIAAFDTSDRAAQQWIWHSRFGTIVIEVRGRDVFVNGDRVAPHAP